MASTENTPSTILPPSPEIDAISNEGAIGRAILNIFVIIFGTFGNSLILRVYWSKMRKNSTQVLVMGLAGVDLAVCLLRVRSVVKFFFVVAGREALPEISAVPPRLAVSMSCVLTGVIAFDRYDSICRPHKRLINNLRAKVVLFVSFVVAVLLELPDLLSLVASSLPLRKLSHTIQITQYLAVFLTTVVCYGRVYGVIRKRARVHIGFQVARTDAPTVSTISRNNQTRPTRKSEPSAIVIESLSSISTSKPAPRSERPTLSTLQTLMSQIPSTSETQQPTENSTHRKVSSLKPPSAWVDTQRQQRATETDTFNRIRLQEPKSGNLPPMREVMQRKVTRMLFITSVVFLLTWLPYWIFVAADLHVLNGGTIGEGVLEKLFGAAVLVAFNSTVNPIIYGLANSQFRKDCAVLFRKCHLCC
ncbi:D(2)-like dopamine receptor [Patiria miniata]|uniref:G-protein coupled receptors family 1 profile domain-containing protein n=1 Tax=Patiria miniata TaxID=46514 RepID=A0A914ACX1_PATMI|nr:D(2)-like dopamine receptor [Patiria miniata]